MSTQSIGAMGAPPITRPAKSPSSFNSLDTNGDGVLSLDELMAGAPTDATKAKPGAAALFKAMDANGDASVSSTEKDDYDKRMGSQRQAMQFMTQMMAGGQQSSANDAIFADTDADGDGSVTLGELSDNAGANAIGADGMQKLFSMIDADGNGTISASESSGFLDKVKSAVIDIASGASNTSSDSTTSSGGMSLADALSDDGEDDDQDQPLDLLNLAQNAYSAGSKQPDILQQLKAIFDTAA